MNVVLSTRNPSKLEQVRALFVGTPYTLHSLDEANVQGEAFEDGLSLEENATKKAEYAYVRVSPFTWVIADDTGLFIKTLDGEPGIHAARWAGNAKSTEEITDYTLWRLENARNRTARFETVVVLIGPDRKRYSFSGSVNGTILEKRRGTPKAKMPYSAIFVPDGQTKTWAEMTVAEENAISHRGKAFTLARDFLKSHRVL